jgi:hypothetical protein
MIHQKVKIVIVKVKCVIPLVIFIVLLENGHSGIRSLHHFYGSLPKH